VRKISQIGKTTFSLFDCHASELLRISLTPGSEC